MAESNSYYIWKNKCALKVIKACWFMNNTPFYYYLQSIMRQATKLTMNALLCDCQLFYKISNRFIYSIIMRIIKLLLFNKLISPASPEPRFEIWLKAEDGINSAVGVWAAVPLKPRSRGIPPGGRGRGASSRGQGMAFNSQREEGSPLQGRALWQLLFIRGSPCRTSPLPCPSPPPSNPP